MLNFKNENNLLDDRSKFLQNLTNHKAVGDRLIKKLELTKTLFANLQAACFNYIVANLIEHEIDYQFNGNYNDFVRDNCEKIIKMSSVTPNGVIRPKSETISHFNSIHKALSLIIKYFNIDKNVNKVRAPISIRIVTSKDKKEILDRPRANNKLHSDFWTGAVCDFAVLIPVFGTIETIDVVFCEPIGFNEEYLQEVTDYSSGRNLYKSYKEYGTTMELGSIFLQDIFCLHGTRRKGEGARISIDFTFQSKQYDDKIKPYYSNKSLNSDNHINIEDWLEIGSNILILEKESIKNLRKNINHYKQTSDIAGKGAAIKLQTSKTMRIINANSFQDILEFESKKK